MLTSDENIKILQEKQEKKQKENELKQERKRQREERKKLKENANGNTKKPKGKIAETRVGKVCAVICTFSHSVLCIYDSLA